MFKLFFLFIFISCTNLVYAENNIIKETPSRFSSVEDLNVVNKLTSNEIDEYFGKEKYYKDIPFNYNLSLNIDLKDLRWVYKENDTLLVNLNGIVSGKNKNESLLDLIIHCPTVETNFKKNETKNTISLDPVSKKVIHEGRVFSELAKIDLPITRKLEVSNPLAELQQAMSLICVNIELISAIRENQRLRDNFLEQKLNESWNKIKM